jgi:predicted dehydrogenase
VPVAVDDAWTVALDLGEARLASVEANFTARGTRAAELELMGERGTLALGLLDVSAPIHVLDARGRWSTIAVDTDRPAGGPDHILGVEHLVERIRGASPPALSAEHAIHVIEILHAAERSAAEGVVVELGTTFDPIS